MLISRLLPKPSGVPLRLFSQLLLMLLFISLLACRESNQNPKDVFYSGKLPPLLQKYKNEQWLLQRKTREIEKLVERNAKQERLVVAVIDNGLDVFHPEIFPYLNWRKDEDGKIRLGYEPMTGSYLANANLIDPAIFAFGAQEIRKGKIYGEVAQPLDLLEKMQTRFAEILLPAIASSKILRDSHFRKITDKNFSFLAALSLLEINWNEALQSYKDSKKEGLLIPSKSIRINQLDPYVRSIPEYLEQVQRIYQSKWAATESGHPNDINQFWQIEHADHFHRVLARVIDQLDQELEVRKALRNYLLFTRYSSQSKHQQANLAADISFENIPTRLKYALSYRLFGANAMDLDRSILQDHYWRAMTEKLLTHPSASLPLRVNGTEIIEFMERGVRRLEMVLANSKHRGQDLDERVYQKESQQTLAQVKAVRDSVKELFVDLSAERLEESLDLSREFRPRSRSERLELLRRYHPFYLRSNASVSHGTHVSGAILQGNHQRVLLEPVRPLTFSMDTSYEKQMELAEGVMQELESFFRHPVVLRGTKALLRQRGLNFSNRKEVFIAELMKFLRREALRVAKEDAMEFLFIDQVVESIRYTGEQKILLANISLGSDFSKASDQKSLDKTHPSEIFEFLYFEFAKYKIAKTLIDYAPHTLFFVAAGNGGDWVDGHSKSALPFDLTSTYFRKFETENEKMPNHIHRNVIGVLATDRHRFLSSFTNFPIHRGTPVVSALGEAVLSSVKRGDPDLSTYLLGKYIKSSDMETNLALSDAKKREILKASLSDKEFAAFERHLQLVPPYEQSDFLNELLFAQEGLHSSRSYYLVRQSSMRKPIDYAYYDGTSMATPNALQASIRIIEKKAKAEGLGLNQLYGRDGYLPGQLIDLILSQAERLNAHEYLFDVPYLSDVRKARKKSNQLELEQALKELKKGKACREILR